MATNQDLIAVDTLHKMIIRYMDSEHAPANGFGLRIGQTRYGQLAVVIIWNGFSSLPPTKRNTNFWRYIQMHLSQEYNSKLGSVWLMTPEEYNQSSDRLNERVIWNVTT